MSTTTNPLRDNLMSMSDEAFEKVVDDDTRNRLAADWQAALRLDVQVVRRWYYVLVASLRSIRGQMAARSDDHDVAVLRLTEQGKSTVDEESTFKQWRARAARVQTGLEERLVQAEQLLVQFGEVVMMDEVVAERDRAREEVGVLQERVARWEAAVSAHRSEVTASDDPSDADLDLWKNLG